MAVKNYKPLLKRLKKQVRSLQRKEEKGKKKVRSALAKSRKLARIYNRKLASSARTMKNKIAEARSSAFEKAALHFERQMVRGIQSKEKSLAAALSKIEKKHVLKLKKGLIKKGRKAGKGKKAKKPVNKAHKQHQGAVRRKKSRKG